MTVSSTEPTLQALDVLLKHNILGEVRTQTAFDLILFVEAAVDVFIMVCLWENVWTVITDQ